MTERQNGVLSHSDGHCKVTDSLSINMKNLQHFNCQREETDNSVLPEREGDGFCTTSELEHLKVVDHIIRDTESGGRDIPNGNDLGEVLYNQPGTRGSKTLTCDEESRDKVLNDPEFERMVTSNDSANRDEHKLSDSGAQIITSKLFPADSSLFTDKSIMEYEVPQLIVSCKDIECQHVKDICIKDICIDKLEQLEEKDLIDKHTDNFVGPHFSKPSSEYGLNETTGKLDSEFHIPDGSISPAESDFSSLTVDKCEAKEERKFMSPVLSGAECPHAGKVKENGTKPEAFMPASKTNVDNKIEKYVLVEEPLVTTILPLENFGTRSFLRSFMDSLNSQGDVDSQQPNQSMKADLKSAETELEPNKSNRNDTKTTLDFSDKPSVTDSLSMNNEEVSEKTLKTEDVPNQNDPFAAHVVQRSDMDEREQVYAPGNEFTNSNNPFLVSEIQNSGKERSIMSTHHESSLKNVEMHSRNPFGVEDQSTMIKVSTEESHPAMTVNHKEKFNPFAFSETESPSTAKDTENIYQVQAESPKRSTNNPFADCEVKSADSDENCKSIDQQSELSNKIAITNNPFAVSEIHGSSLPKSIQYSDQQPELNRKGSSYNPFDNPEPEGASQDKVAGNPLTGIGDTSFSAVSGRITYSGPIAASGSTSLRSESSTTSTRSFAFPVLQSEWNSSPVRMERADRRKQRGSWKHGILCCKF